MQFNVIAYTTYTPCWGKSVGFFEVLTNTADTTTTSIVFGRVIDGILYAMHIEDGGNSDHNKTMVLRGIKACTFDGIHCGDCPYGPPNETLGACMFNLMEHALPYLDAELNMQKNK